MEQFIASVCLIIVAQAQSLQGPPWQIEQIEFALKKKEETLS